LSQTRQSALHTFVALHGGFVSDGGTNGGLEKQNTRTKLRNLRTSCTP